MAEITMYEVTELADPKLRELAMQVVNELRLAAEKAVAHSEDPKAYPMPQDPNSAEQIFLDRFRELRPETKQAAVAKSMPFVKASEAVRARRYGDLAKVNLRSATPVAAQVKALPFPEHLKFPTSNLAAILSTVTSCPLKAARWPASSSSWDELSFWRCQLRLTALPSSSYQWEHEVFGREQQISSSRARG
jgi:hypothetical protein